MRPENAARKPRQKRVVDMESGTGKSIDVLVIGGGLIGCAIALRLAQAKLRVAVVDRGEPGCEASGAGAGMIAPQGETTEPDDLYTLCAASRDLYPAFAAEVEELSGQSVRFSQQGTLFAALDESQAAEIDRVYRSQAAAGLVVERLGPGEAHRLCPQLAPANLGALLMTGDHRVDNEVLIAALQAACRRAGVTFHLHTTVTRLGARAGRVETADAQNGAQAEGFTAGVFVLAAGAWSGEVAASLGIPIATRPCRGQLIELQGADNFSLTLRAGHHYLVPRSGGRLVAGSNMEYAGFSKAVTAEGLRSILASAEKMAPAVGRMQFRRAWAGLRPDTADHLPILGRAEPANLILATGHFRNGILLTPVTAKLISELILSGSSSMPIDVYSPLRFGRGRSVAPAAPA